MTQLPAGQASTAPDARRCARCLFDEHTPSAGFDEHGVCAYCRLYDQMDAEYPVGERGDRILAELADTIRRDGRGKKFDVVVGVSGGCDSSYLIYRAKELGLRPLAAHFDNTWDSTVAVENIHRVLKTLDVELFTHVVDNEEYDDIYRSFLLAGLPDVEAPTDIGLATTLYLAARKYGIKWIFEGHSFRTEGVSPLGWLYMDARYIQSVVKAHGNYAKHRMRTFPNLWFTSFLKWMVVDGIKKVRPLYWMDYQKEATKTLLADKFGWRWYGGHHLENRFTAFYHTYLIPRRLKIDLRVNGYAGLVRCGQMPREEGLRQLAQPIEVDAEVLDLVKKRLRFSDAEFERVMNLPLRTYREYATYKPLFERLRPLFWLLYKLDRVPKSFYTKYTSRTGL